jgi:hypothetical protein
MDKSEADIKNVTSIMKVHPIDETYFVFTKEEGQSKPRKLSSLNIRRAFVCCSCLITLIAAVVNQCPDR